MKSLQPSLFFSLHFIVVMSSVLLRVCYAGTPLGQEPAHGSRAVGAWQMHRAEGGLPSRQSFDGTAYWGINTTDVYTQNCNTDFYFLHTS